MSTAPEGTPVIPRWTFADRLRKVRREVTEMGQVEFAQQLGVGPPTLSAWEAGRTVPRDVVAVAKRVELATGVPAGWLLGVMDSAPTPEPPGPSRPTPRSDLDRVTERYSVRERVAVSDLSQVRRDRRHRPTAA